MTPSGTLAALGLDASGIGTLVDPPRPAGDFKVDVDAFTTIEDCMRDRAKVDPVVGDALENIGYDTFLRDARSLRPTRSVWCSMSCSPS